MPEYKIYFAKETHKNYLMSISIFWKLRQQLLWGLGVCQIIVLTTLAAKISLFKDFFDPACEPISIRLKLSEVDNRTKWFNLGVTAAIVITTSLLLVFTYPIWPLIEMKTYAITYLVQLGLTACILVALLFYIKSNI